MPKLAKPRFTAPTIDILTPTVIGNVALARVHIVDSNGFRPYSTMDIDPEVATIRVLEEALHREWAKLEEHRAVVRHLARELKTRRQP